MKYPVSFDLELRKNPYPGRLITIEGIDGAGKTTQAKELVKRLNKNGGNAAYTKEPTDLVIGQFIREKILSGNLQMHPVALQYLFNADRVMHMEKIETFLKKGLTVVMDRYFWSAVAYAIADVGGDLDQYLTAFSILSSYHQFIVPDETFYLDITADKALERIQASGKHTEIYDNKEKLPKIVHAYTLLMKKFPDQFTIIAADKTPEKVTDEIVDLLKK
jgi:dTMP kinase